MLYNVQKKHADEKLFDILNTYIQSKNIRLIKKTNNTFLFEIKGPNTRLNTAIIRNELHKAGYSTSVVSPSVYSLVRNHRTHYNQRMRRSSITNRILHNSIVRLKVAAPNPPKSPTPFPDPNGTAPNTPSKKTKGK